MGAFIKRLVAKLIPKNIAGILGVVQTVIPFIRELLMLATRICAVLIPGDKDDKIIAKIKYVFDKFEVVFEKVKNFFLKVGE